MMSEVPPIAVKSDVIDDDSMEESQDNEPVDQLDSDPTEPYATPTALTPTEDLGSPIPPTATPRPFPLSPPTPSQELHVSDLVLALSDADESDDLLPSVEKMLADTRPAYATPNKCQRARQKSRSNTVLNDTVNYAVKMDVDTQEQEHLVSIKRQTSQSPTLIQPTPKHSKRRYSEITMSDRTYIEILSSDSDREPMPSSSVKKAAPSASTSNQPSFSQPRPTPKPKRKRSDLSSQSTITAVASTSTLSTSPSQHFKLPPSKRAKINKSHSSFHKHPKHWELDGNTLVQIGNIRFKLQRSHLARHGEWFRLTFEQGDAAPELYDDGVLHLDRLDISVRDFTTLLDALDDAITYIHTPPPFPTLFSILRASHALSFTAFQEWATRELEEMWPPFLKDLSTNRIPHATESLALARLCGLTRVMKRAMYELVRSPGYGQNDADDADADADADDEDDMLGGGMGIGTRGGGRKKHTELGGADKDALTRARERLTSLWIMTAGSVAKDFMHCPNAVPAAAAAHGNNANQAQNDILPQPCTTTTPGLPLAHMRLVHESGLMEEYAFDAVCGLKALMDAPWVEAGFCVRCVEMRRKSWQGAREKVWENLGIWFGLGVDEDRGGESGEEGEE